MVVDNTFATPIVQRPLELGATAVVHSTTKYLGGHSDVVGGAVICADAELHERVRFVQNSVGAVPGPFDCFLVHRGLRTLALRVARHARERARGQRVAARRRPGSRTCAGRASAAWSPSATPTRSGSSAAPSSSRSPSRSAGSSR